MPPENSGVWGEGAMTDIVTYFDDITILGIERE
jgi:hypothetical protein